MSDNQDNRAVVAARTIPSVKGDSPEETAATATMELALSHRSAPLPRPEELRAYEDILPGAAQRIFAMAEEKHLARIEQGNAIIQSKNEILKRGQDYAMATVAASMLGGVALAALGCQTAAAVCVGASLLNLVANFLSKKGDDEDD